MILVEPRALRLASGEFFRSPRIPVDPLTARLQLRLRRPTTGGTVAWDETSQLAIKLLLFVDGVEYKVGGKASGGIRLDFMGQEMPEYVLTWNPTVALRDKGREFMSTRSPDERGFYRGVPLTRIGETASEFLAQIIVESRRGPGVQTEILLAELLTAPAPTRDIKNSVAFDAATSTQEVGGDATISLTHTAAGSNRAAHVGCHNAAATPQATNSVTYAGGGSTVTELWDVTGGTFMALSGHRVVNPATGAQVVEATFAGNTNSFMGVVSMTGVNQATPTGTVPTPAQGTDTAPTVTVTDAVAGDLVVDTLCANNSNFVAAVDAGQTLGWDEQAASGGAGSSYQAGADGGVMSWTLTGTPATGWIIGAVAYKQALFSNDDGWMPVLGLA